MVAIPAPISHTVLAIDAATAAEAQADAWDSAGIPMSSVGDPCDRALWYLLRWAAEPEQMTGPKARRLRGGRIFEPLILDGLAMTGADVRRIDPATGKQYAVALAGGWLRGRMDAVATGIIEAPKAEHVVEGKAMNERAFKDLEKKGLRDAKHDHYAQVQLYMHGSGIHRCLYLALSKNTDELYAERVAYDPAFALALVARVERIVAAQRPPVRLHDDPSSKSAFACQWCRARPQCHEAAFSRANCRTCLHSSLADGGRVICERGGRALSYEQQQAGCPAHRYVPDLVPGEQVDVIGDDVVIYRLADGSEWRDGAGVA
jgi:GTP cyclohydrolase II